MNPFLQMFAADSTEQRAHSLLGALQNCEAKWLCVPSQSLTCGPPLMSSAPSPFMTWAFFKQGKVNVLHCKLRYYEEKIGV